MNFNSNLAAGLGIGIGIIGATLVIKLFPVLVAGGIAYGISRLVLVATQENEEDGKPMDTRRD